MTPNNIELPVLQQLLVIAKSEMWFLLIVG